MFAAVLTDHGYQADSEYGNKVRFLLLTTGTGDSIIDDANTWSNNHQLLIYKQAVTPSGFSYGDRNFIYIALGV